VIAIVVLLSSCAGALALSLLVLSDQPFDRAFEVVSGAHLTVVFDTARVSSAQVAATASLAQVSAAAGPFRALPVPLDLGGKGPGGQVTVPVAGRSGPGGPVDRLTLTQGRWAAAPGEVVVGRDLATHLDLALGDTLTPAAGSGLPPLKVVGVALGVGEPIAAWVLPRQLPVSAAGKAQPQYWMYYRLHAAAAPADITGATRAIGAAVPAGSIVDTRDWLTIKRDADITNSVMIPFLLAFSAFALVAAALIISNVVTGAVIAGYRDIGIMKSIGFTPGQVVGVLLLQMMAPGLLGCAVGIPLGVLASQPFLYQTSMAFDLPQSFSVAPLVDLALASAVAVVVGVAAFLPALRAGRLSTVGAISRGTAPQTRGMYRATRWLAGLPWPRPLSLGAGESFARPARSLMTLLAIGIAVATITFASGLVSSLRMVAMHVIRDQAAPVSVRRSPEISDQQASALIRAQPGTARFVAETEVDAYVTGIAQPARFDLDRNDSSWLGYAVIRGRWFQAPGEVVATTELLRQANSTVGDVMTVTIDGHRLRLRVVGSYLDQSNDLLLRGDWSNLAAAGVQSSADFYEVGLRPGVNPRAYTGGLTAAATPAGSIDASPKGSSAANTSFLLIQSVLVWLAATLTLIGMAGVFNTVVLNTREKAREIGVMKAIGMTPGQTVAMVLCSVALLGLLGGLGALPLGEALHHRILATMAQIAAKSELPDSFSTVFSPLWLTALVAGGMLVAMLGGWLPARWAARSPVTDVLRTE
jgi:putative ABC transport system permease protein